MIIDAREYPPNYLLSEVAAERLGCHVYVAHFVEHHGRRLFRMIIDADLGPDLLENLMTGCVRDQQGTYEFQSIEAVTGPVVDHLPRRSPLTSYQRVTFM